MESYEGQKGEAQDRGTQSRELLFQGLHCVPIETRDASDDARKMETTLLVWARNLETWREKKQNP